MNECILPQLKPSWDKNYKKYFDSEGIACVLLIENQAASATYYSGRGFIFFSLKLIELFVKLTIEKFTKRPINKQIYFRKNL